jgi:hypothetical protein
MTICKRFGAWAVLASTVALMGCASQPKAPYDYTAFRQSMPRSILVLPPTNASPEIKAGASVFAQVTTPLAESGYYVVPVSLVSETLRENGVQTPEEARQLPPTKLRSIFGADAVLDIHVTEFGSKFMLINSITTVAATARLVDLKSGQQLWDGTVRLQHDGGSSQQGGGLAGLLVAAVVKQIANTVSDQGHVVAGMATNVMLRSGREGGLLPGPRAPAAGPASKP